MIDFDPDELPPDPDLGYVPEDLRILHGLGKPVKVIDLEDGTVTHAALVIAPGLFGDAARADEGIEPFRED
jgi:hypothetical protein